MWESTCRKVGRCLEDNYRWQQLQLWFRSSSTTSSPSPSPSSSSSSSAFPSSSLSNPFSLDHPLFRHYFRIRSSFCHFSLLSPTITRTKGHFEKKDQRGYCYSAVNLSREWFQDFRNQFHFGYQLVTISAGLLCWIFLTERLLNHFGFEEDWRALVARMNCFQQELFSCLFILISGWLLWPSKQVLTNWFVRH